MHHIPIINRLNQPAFLLSSLLSIQFLVCPLYVHYDRDCPRSDRYHPVPPPLHPNLRRCYPLALGAILWLILIVLGQKVGQPM
jgi:hypothetical protein